MLDDASTIALLRQLADQQRRDLIDACLQAVAGHAGVAPEYAGRLVKLAAMIGEPDHVAPDDARKQHDATVEAIAAWIESGAGMTTPGNRLLSDRIRGRFLRGG